MMPSLFLLTLLALQHGTLFSQSSPLGATVERLTAKPVPRKLQKMIPDGAALRVLLEQQTKKVLVYESAPNPPSAEPNAHIVTISDNEKKDIAVASLCEFGEQYTPTAYKLFRLENRQAIAIAFRNIGDGSGSLFVILLDAGSGFHLAWASRVSEGQLRLMPSKFELWAASGSSEGCTWCHHYYDVTIFSTNGDKIVSTAKRRTRAKLDPVSIVSDPLAVGRDKEN